MAIARGAGTEIIRAVHHEELDGAGRTFIFGVQHHIYTVLSIIAFAYSLQADRNWIEAHIAGYDALEGTTGQDMLIFKQDMTAWQTFVWNDKFSFNGHEPTDFAGPMDTVVKQDAIADQGSGVAQYLFCSTTHADDSMELTITFIDQNNA